MDLVNQLLTPQVLAISAAIVALLWGVGQVKLGKGKLADNKWWRKFLPIIPLALGVAGAFAVGQFGDGAEKVQEPILTGLWAGFVAAHGRKIIKRLVKDKLGGDEK